METERLIALRKKQLVVFNVVYVLFFAALLSSLISGVFLYFLGGFCILTGILGLTYERILLITADLYELWMTYEKGKLGGKWFNLTYVLSILVGVPILMIAFLIGLSHFSSPKVTTDFTSVCLMIVVFLFLTNILQYFTILYMDRSKTISAQRWYWWFILFLIMVLAGFIFSGGSYEFMIKGESYDVMINIPGH